MAEATHDNTHSRGNVAEIYAQPSVDVSPIKKSKKRRVSQKTMLIIVSSALMTFLIGMGLLIVFK